MTRILDLPSDILIVIVSKSQTLNDAIALIQTSTQLYSLSNQRIFWITILDNLRSTTALSCRHFDDFSALDLPTLQSLAYRALKQDREWRKAQPLEPTLITSFGTMTTGRSRRKDPGLAGILALIPGTSLLLTAHEETKNGRYGRCVRCWNVNEGKLLATYSSEYRVLSTPGALHNKAGEVILPLIEATTSSASLQVLRLVYDPQYLSATLEHVFQAEVSWFMQRCIPVAANDEIVVTLVNTNNEEKVFIKAWNFNSKQSILVETDILPSEISSETDHEPACWFEGRDVFIIFYKEENGTSFAHIPASTLPYNDTHPSSSAYYSTRSRITIAKPVIGGFEDTLAAQAYAPSQPGLAVMVHELESHTLVNFWKTGPRVLSQTTLMRSIWLDYRIEKAFVSDWGRSVLVLSDTREGDIVLLRYRPDGDISLSQLRFPSALGIKLKDEKEFTFALDDRLGVVYFVSEGVVFVVSYK